MKPKTKAKHIHKVLSEVAAKYEYDPPVLIDNIIQWDGPFEWAISALGGEGVCSGEGYGMFDPEPKLQKVLNTDGTGLAVECETAHSLGVY